MRTLFIYLLLGMSVCASAQTSAHSQESPASKTYQAKQAALLLRGAEALKAEYAREKTNVCQNEKDSNSQDDCFGRELDVTQKNYETYVKAIGGLLRLRDPDDPDSAQYPDRGKELDRSELLWTRYREAQCEAFSDQFFGGTIRPLEFLGCKQDLTRRHMHELDSLYGDLWN